MRTIKLKELHIINFKGVRELNLYFDEDRDTMVCGENGTGKTTVFDAFTWLLFGKDSKGRSDSNFNIKTLDNTGAPILHLEHSVMAVLTVDGHDIKLQRNYAENWVKPRGTTEETLQSHKSEFYINDVKQGTKKDYDAEISAIIQEDVFRVITDPFYFTSLSAETQKSMLLDITGGDVSDDDMVALNPEFVAFLGELAGRPIAKYTREIAARKKGIKDELAVIPSQLETANKLKPEADNWQAIEDLIKDKTKQVAELDAAINDKSKIGEEEYKRKADLQRTIGEKRLAMANRQNEIRSEANKERNAAIQAAKDLEFQIQSKRNVLKYKIGEANSIAERIAKQEQDLKVKRQEYITLYQTKLEISDDAYICPTCGRPLEADSIEAKRAELTANFNQKKSEDLLSIQTAGKQLSAGLTALQNQQAHNHQDIEQLDTEIENMSKELVKMQREMPAAEDADALIASDTQCINLTNEIADLENQTTVAAKPVDVSDLQARKQQLNGEIQDLYKCLAQRDQIERADKEIAELLNSQTTLNQALADLEKCEFTALSYQKAKDEEILSRINGLFQVVSFSFVSQQLNGGEKLTCTCTVNGTPYPDVNNAGKINAGLDIINAICTAKGVTAPIFVDNAESVNNILETKSQKVLLYVTDDKAITTK